MDILNDEFLSFIKCAQVNSLRYLLIGGYAVNYYGYSRNTKDMDVWIAPTNENKAAFINTLLCLKYSDNEVSPLINEDFTKPFMGSIGSSDNTIDILTVVHHSLSFDVAEKNKNSIEITAGYLMHFVPYDFLKDMKLFARRNKDLWDIARLEEILTRGKNDF
jgi:hypothetical protein